MVDYMFELEQFEKDRMIQERSPSSSHSSNYSFVDVDERSLAANDLHKNAESPIARREASLEGGNSLLSS
jgi:hypothetical protein